ncbi:MAG: hypothetical protein EPN88_15960 [Bacteroidetes bacterium]|nr:MAG: hypothetical protein EPN88_15960 [Bacteroidota bacterium]
MKNPLQAHSANIKYEANLNPLLRKELAKIKVSVIKKVSKAHLQLESPLAHSLLLAAESASIKKLP